MDDIIHRLRCKYPVGPMINGEPEFGWRDFSGPAPKGMMLPAPISIEAANEIESLRVKLAEAEKDAERYRYIRSNGGVDKQALDEEIDAAIAKQKGESK